EGLVDDDAFRSEARRDHRQERAMEIVRDDDRVPVSSEPPWAAILEVERDHLAGNVAERADVAIDRGDPEAERGKGARVAPLAGREVEHPSARPNQGGKPHHPGRRGPDVAV